MPQTAKPDGIFTLTPRDNLTSQNAGKFRQDLLHLVETGCTHITLNLNQVNFIDSQGLAVLVSCHKSVSEKGGDLTVITDNRNLQHLFEVIRLDEGFTLQTSG